MPYPQAGRSCRVRVTSWDGRRGDHQWGTGDYVPHDLIVPLMVSLPAKVWKLGNVLLLPKLTVKGRELDR